MPCIETYQKVDLRTITLGVPPQEVFFSNALTFTESPAAGSDQGQCHCVSGCRGESSLFICYWEDFNFLTT